MSWYEEVCQTLDADSILWLLAMTQESGTTAGVGRTTNYHSLRGKIMAFSKKIGVSDAGVKAGYDRLTRVLIDTPIGKDKILRQDKPELVRFTPVGIALVAQLSSDQALRKRLIVQIGGSLAEPLEWFPATFKEDAPVKFVTESKASDTLPYSIQVAARFKCGRCSSEIVHEFDLVWQDGQFDPVDATCGKCGAVWQHFRGSPYPAPWVSPDPNPE